MILSNAVPDHEKKGENYYEMCVTCPTAIHGRGTQDLGSCSFIVSSLRCGGRDTRGQTTETLNRKTLWVIRRHYYCRGQAQQNRRKPMRLSLGVGRNGREVCVQDVDRQSSRGFKTIAYAHNSLTVIRGQGLDYDNVLSSLHLRLHWEFWTKTSQAGLVATEFSASLCPTWSHSTRS